ncbi:MAG: roadblock/LC7 domain-containing protein [Promethearchaeota archaeon]
MENSALSIAAELKDLLRNLSNHSPVLGSAIFSDDGRPLVSHFHAGTDEAIIAAIVASIYGTGEQAVQQLRQGELKSVIVQGTMGTTLVISVISGYLLAVTAPDNAKLGLIFNDAKKLAREAARILR